MKDFITQASDLICGYPLFIVLIGGGLFLFFYSRMVPFRYFGRSIEALRAKDSGKGEAGQISSWQARMLSLPDMAGAERVLPCVQKVLEPR